MNLAGGPPGGMSGSMGGQINLGMTGMPSGAMGMHGAPMSGAPGGGMNMGMGSSMNAAMGTMGNAGVGSMGNVPSIGSMGNLGSVNMNANTIGGLGAGGSMLGGAGGGLMGPPVIPQSMQRPERDQMMQRERSSSLHGREQVRSTFPFFTYRELIWQTFFYPLMCYRAPEHAPGVCCTVYGSGS